MKETITRKIDGKWTETLVRNTKTGKIAAFNREGKAAFGKSEGTLQLYSPKQENGKRKSLGEAFLNGIIRAFLK